MASYTVATDGSALNNPHGAGGWAWVVDKRRWNAGSHPKASNQVMEIFAILQALRQIPLHHDLHFQTDSAFCVNMIGKDGKGGWMRAWKSKGWRKADGKPPANLQLVQALDSAIQARTGRLKFEWVKGHAGHQLNTIADKLCTTASATQNKGTPFRGGPGWTDDAPLPTRSATPSPQRRSTPKQQRPSTITPTRTRRASEYIITSFDDGDDRAVVKRQTKQQGTYCDSCNGPINLATGECRCSD